YGINDAGQIVGYGRIGDEFHGYLLTPDGSPLAALVTAAPGFDHIGAAAVTLLASEGAPVDRPTLPGGVDSSGGPVSPAAENWFPRSVTVVANPAAVRADVAAGDDLLADELARLDRFVSQRPCQDFLDFRRTGLYRIG